MMPTSENHQVEQRLRNEDYKTINKELEQLSSQRLLSLLDSKSRKIGDTAASLLNRRRETSILVDALLENQIKSALGRVRATNVLNWNGRSVPRAVEAHLHSLSDRSDDVVRNSLFGIVFMRRRDLIPALREYMALAGENSRRQRDFRDAIVALEADDPPLFSPGFRDANNVWLLLKSEK